MSAKTRLCVLPEPPPGCCGAPIPPPAAPLTPYNQPGLSAIQYRIGTFTSFRRAMLDMVALPTLLDTQPDALFTVTSPPAASPPTLLVHTPNPFAGWREKTDGDYHTAFIELWAYLADILTFYQERIANEAFLPTATQRDSLLRLSRLIDYRPSPGAAAIGLLAFTVEKDKTVTVPKGFRAGSKAQPARPAAVFETSAGLTALANSNAIPLSSVAPLNQFARLDDYKSLANPDPHQTDAIAGVVASLYPNAGATYARSFQHRAASSGRDVFAASYFSSIGVLNADSFKLAGENTRTVVLKGINNRLATGDYVLAVAGAQQGKPYLFQLTSASVDKASATTTVTWEETSPPDYQGGNVTVYAFRVRAGVFGNTAPRYESLPLALIDSDPNRQPQAPFQTNWDLPGYTIPSSSALFLDSVYDKIQATPQSPSWAALLNDGQVQIVHVIDARQASHSDYAITSKVTRLTFRAPESIQSGTFPLRTTMVLAGTEPLELENNLPLPGAVAGLTLILSGIHRELQAGQQAIVRGKLADPVTQQPTLLSDAEPAVLAAAPAIDETNGITTVTLKRPLVKQYVRAGAVLLANVVEVTQGETVKDEVLGSSDGSALQGYRLRKNPLTWLASSDPEGLAAVQSTLQVQVNGVLWKERPTLLESAPDAQEYTTSQDDAGQTTLTFGDGIAGAVPHSGRDNIRARYRKGLGVSGNVPPDGIQQLIDSAPGLQKVTNAVASTGGADPENIGGIRANAPAGMRAFGRAVSVADYANLALTFPGIAKASASWVLRDANLVALPQPFLQLTVATADQIPLTIQTGLKAKLRNYLDRRRDPNVPLRIVDVTPVYIDVAVTVDVDARFPRQATVAHVANRLNPGLNPDGSAGYFAFQSLGFGESIHLSAVYATVQDVPGVSDARITTLRRMDQDAADPAMVRDDIFIRPTEMASIGNDPGDPSKGGLVVSAGMGGFDDA
jgi:predicted phage baseplate assembly protein